MGARVSPSETSSTFVFIHRDTKWPDLRGALWTSAALQKQGSRIPSTCCTSVLKKKSSTMGRMGFKNSPSGPQMLPLFLVFLIRASSGVSPSLKCWWWSPHFGRDQRIIVRSPQTPWLRRRLSPVSVVDSFHKVTTNLIEILSLSWQIPDHVIITWLN